MVFLIEELSWGGKRVKVIQGLKIQEEIQERQGKIQLLDFSSDRMETSTERAETTPHQPGKSWIVLEEDDGHGLGLPLLMATGGLAVFGIVAITLYKMCRKMPEEEVGDEDFSVAVSNSMFRDDRPGETEQLSLKEMPCLNCRLIEMGEMACYTDRCSQCGRVPPGRKAPTKMSQKRNGSGGTGSATTNSRQQPPPQYSSSTMAQYQQGSQYQGQQGYVGNVDRIPEQGGQYRGQYQGRGQPRPQYQQQGV